MLALKELAQSIGALARLGEARYATRELAEAAVMEERSVLVKELAGSEKLGGSGKAIHEIFVDAFDGAKFVEDEDAVLIKFGESSRVDVGEVLREVRKGDTESLLKLLSDDAAGAAAPYRHPDFLENLREVMRRVYPDAEIESILRRSRAAEGVPPRLYETPIADATSLTRLAVTDEDLKKLLDGISETVRKSRGGALSSAGPFVKITITAATVAGGAAAIFEALEQAAARSVGCWRVFIDGRGGVGTCKILNATCAKNVPFSADDVCKTYPSTINAHSCESWTEKTPCTKCDPSAQVGSADYLSAEEFVRNTDMYVCRSKPSLGEMLGQIVADVPDVAKHAVTDVVNTVGDAWSSVKDLLLRGGLLVIIFYAIYVWYINGRGGETFSKGRRARASSETGGAAPVDDDSVHRTYVETRATRPEYSSTESAERSPLLLRRPRATENGARNPMYDRGETI